MKQVSGMSSMRKMMRTWVRSENNDYLYCREWESTSHVLAYKDEAVIQRFKNMVENLDQ